MRPTSRQFKLSWQEQLGVASVEDSDGQMAMKELVDIYEKRSLRARFRSRMYASIAVKRTQMLHDCHRRPGFAGWERNALRCGGRQGPWRSRLSASSDLAKRPHAPVRTTRGARPPGLLCLVFWYPPRRRRSIGRRLRRFGKGFCECDAGLRLVLVETTAFVFATGAAPTGFVASEPSNRRFIHPQCSSLRRRKLTSDRRSPSAADLATA
jgi:hypothetical protein